MPAITVPFEALSLDAQGEDILTDLFSSVQVEAPRDLARALLGEFGTLARALSAGLVAQMRVIGDRPDVLRCLGLVRQVTLHMLAAEVLSAPVLGDWQAVTDYLHASMAHEPREQFRVLFLNQRNRLLRDEVLGHGTVNAAPVYPREVIRRGLELGASALILAHNHPSGEPQPSRDDIQMTRAIIDAGRHIGIGVHDHLIVARTGHYSMRANGLI